MNESTSPVFTPEQERYIEAKIAQGITAAFNAYAAGLRTLDMFPQAFAAQMTTLDHDDDDDDDDRRLLVED